MGRTKKAIEALEDAYELDPKTATLRQILAIYEAAGNEEAAMATTARIEAQIIKENAAKAKRATQKGRKTNTATKAGARAVKKVVTKPVRATRATSKIIKQHVGRKRV